MSSEERDTLIFNESPAVEFATNTFINVPVILQYDDTPLIEVVKLQEAGFSSQFNIYHSDGTHLAVAKGSRLFPTPEGLKANLQMRHPAGATVCELDGKPLFEIRRKEAAGLKTEAELYTPDGAFVRGKAQLLLNEKKPELVQFEGKPLQIGQIQMQGCEFRNFRIGIHLMSDGSMGIGLK